jgi:uncharacterized membrane protein
MSQGPGVRERDLDRLLTFVDAIVAIAITLLILPLIELPRHAGQYASVGELLQDNEADIWAFLLSFAVVSRLWFVQHRAVRHLVGYDERVAGVLMLWALTIVFLPFPTGLVAEAGDSTVTKALYIGTIFVSTVLVTCVQALLGRHPQLTDGGEEVDLSPGIANAALLVVALVLAVAVPVTSYFPLLLLIAADWLAAAWRRWRRRAGRLGPS